MGSGSKLKLNINDILVFIVPFVILSLIIGFVGHTNSIRRIRDINTVVENSTMDIADSYAQMLTNTQEMNSIIENLMEEKLLLVGEAISLLDQNKIDSKKLKELAERFQVWRINIFDNRGVIINSNEEGNIGWTTYDGHPSYLFLFSGEETFIEDIRMGSINEIYFKFGYIKRENNTFIQIGMEAEDFHKFTRNFQAKKVIESIMARENIQQAFLVDMDGRVVASSMNITPGVMVSSKDILNHVNDKEPGVVRHTIMGKDVLLGFAPMYIGDKRAGLLSIAWDTSIIDTAVREIIYSTLGEIVIIIAILGSVLYYAYRKNKYNLKIAYYDKLTGLPNKEYLEEVLDEFIGSSEEKNSVIFFINLRNFKLVNMTFGYNYGDKILINVSREISKLLGQDDILFRFNADRFILLKEGIETSEKLRDFANRIIKVSKNISEENHRLEYINFEVGIMELDKYSSIDKLSRDMSFALANNNQASDRVIFYNQSIEEIGSRQKKMETILEDIIEGKDVDSLYLEFQPKLDIKTNKIMGFEALARLNHKDLGKVSPLEFISLAEDRMLIYDLGMIIFRKACEFLKELQVGGYKDINVSVNISAMQILRNRFIEDIKEITGDLNVDIRQIELEITESVLIDNMDLINSRLDEIQKLGMSVSIDDFGTGFSSFYRLKNLSIDILKIDKYFIDQILLEDENRLISMDIISMAHRLGLVVVAEGVEVEKQKVYLEKHNCDIIQGYLISRPLIKEEAIKLMNN